MIVINILILAFCFFGKLCEGANSDFQDGGRFRQFLRRRTGSQVKRDSVTVEPVDEVTSRKFIGFGLRQRTKSHDNPMIHPSPPTASLSNAVFGFFSSAVNEIGKTFDAIDNLEKKYADETMSRNFPVALTFVNDPKRASVVNQLLSGVFNGFDDEEKDADSDSGSSGDVPNKRDMAASGISLSGGEESSDYDGESKSDSIGEIIEGSIHSDGVTVDYLDVESHGIDTEFQLQKDHKEDSVKSENKKLERREFEALISANSDEIQCNYTVLSDSDSESWEKVENNMIGNVKILVRQPDVAKFVASFGNDKNNLINFLTTVFVKLAQKLFFNPAADSKLKTQGKSDSFEELSTEFEGMVVIGPDGELVHRVLDFEMAHRILFFNHARDESDDWDWCLILPTEEDFALALDYVSERYPDDMNTIKADLPRLPVRFYDYYAERRGRGPLATDAAELIGKIKSILTFIMAFESKEVSNEIDSIGSSSTLPLVDLDAIGKAVIPAAAPFKNQKIRYSQGFDSLVAYFAINFDLDCAGPLAYRFFQLYLSELVNTKVSETRMVVRRIDARAISIVRSYLSDQVGGVYVLDFEVLLGILELYPFSDFSACLLYTTSATTWTDLDRLIQFLLLKVPQSEAYKSISLLAAANMLFSMLSLEKLFRKELLGSEEWAGLKDQLGHLHSHNQRRKMLDTVVLKFMGDMFLLLKDKIVHAGEEFDEFLKVAESLVPYLHHFK